MSGKCPEEESTNEDPAYQSTCFRAASFGINNNLRGRPWAHSVVPNILPKQVAIPRQRNGHKPKEESQMKTRLVKTVAFALLLLGSMTIYADGSPIPWCPGVCPTGGHGGRAIDKPLRGNQR